MADPQTTREAALRLLEKLVDRDKAYDAVNLQIRALQQDFPSVIHMMDSDLYPAVLTLIDAALGDDIGSYFMNECRTMPGGGAVTTLNGTRWPIASVEDVRAYLDGACHEPA